MHTRKLSKFGHSHYILIDKTLLSLAGIKERDEVQLTIEKGKIVVAPLKKKAG